MNTVDFIFVAWEVGCVVAIGFGPRSKSNALPALDMPKVLLQGDGFIGTAYYHIPSSVQKNKQSEECGDSELKCKTGKCIPQRWQCDGESDCEDGEDEDQNLCKPPVSCKLDEFRCVAQKNCIPSGWRCDGTKECADGSDEDKCTRTSCKEDEYACAAESGSCIPSAWLCDAERDCLDGSDETICNGTCTADEFTCKSGRCIQKHWVCDREDDCGDNSDEAEHCPVRTCNAEQFDCGSGNCIPLKWRCDGDNDCPEPADELGCPQNTSRTHQCSDQEFMCADKINCVHVNWRCDGDPDCPDKSDEAGCAETACRSDQFRCHNGDCIPAHLHCSSEAECKDGSDELNCTVTVIADACHLESQFYCGGGYCIDGVKLCDGQNDCGDWSDEPAGSCNTNECSINNGGCQHECHDTAIGFKCACHKGYQLIGNSSCEDVNECLEHGVCSQGCVNEKGSFKCDCIDGYRRDPKDRTMCKAIEGHASLIFAHGVDIRRISLDRQDMTQLVNETKSVSGIDFDFKTGMLYWSDTHLDRIYRSPLDEGYRAEVVITGEVTSDGLAVDWIYNHLYWTDHSKKTIEMSDLDGKMRTVIISDQLREPRSLAVNPLDGWLYWSDWGRKPAGRIERAAMDGTYRQTIVDTDVMWPNGITLDYVLKRLYWIDAKLHRISSCNYDGSDKKIIIQDRIDLVEHPFSITTFEDTIYWSDWNLHSIMKANKFTGKDAQAVVNSTFHIRNPMSVHVYHQYRQPDGPNLCQPLNGRCSHFCMRLPVINNMPPRIACACPTGMRLQNDTVTCEEESQNLPILKETLDEEPVPNGEEANLPVGLIVGLVVLFFLLVIIGFVVYKYVLRKGGAGMNFDNPVYQKTTEDRLVLQKNGSVRNARPYSGAIPEDSLEPLTRPGTSEYV